MRDNLQSSRQAFHALSIARNDRAAQFALLLDDIETQLNGPQTLHALSASLTRLADKAAGMAREMIPADIDDSAPDLVFWIEAFTKTVAGKNAVSNAPPTAIMVFRLRRICSGRTSPPSVLIRNGAPISAISGRAKDGCIWLWSSTCSPAASLAGPSVTACTSNWLSKRSARPSSCGGRKPV
jgi:hypothetical protein